MRDLKLFRTEIGNYKKKAIIEKSVIFYYYNDRISTEQQKRLRDRFGDIISRHGNGGTSKRSLSQPNPNR